MITYETIKAVDNTKIRLTCIKPTTQPKGVIQIIHGFGEGIVHYIDIANFFAQLGYVSVIHDQRGHGEMPELTPKERQSARGISPSYNHLLLDLESVHDYINHHYPTLPTILYGHSMGGNIALNYLYKNPKATYSKLILESPWFRLYKPVSKATATLAKLLGSLSPNIALTVNLNKAHICRNPQRVKSLETDPIYHNRISLRLVSQISEAGENLLKNPFTLPIPTLLLCPKADKIVCPMSITEFAKNAGSNLILKEYPDAYHALRYDSVSDVVLTDIRLFLVADIS